MLTFCIRVVFWPLSQKSFKSMEQMKKLQPMMKKLREKHKDDKEALNKEMMQLYKTYKVNPAGGCLPIVVQIPVFIGLYQALLNSIELRHASFIEYLPFTHITWLADLSGGGPVLYHASAHGRVHVPPAAPHARRRRSHPAEGHDVHARHLYGHVHQLPRWSGHLLAVQQHPVHRAAVVDVA